jgi:RNA polymerase sigma factor (sigma-70 family)
VRRPARDDLLALIHPLVLKYCRARLGRQESLMGSADDVAQDVCMAVVGALPNYQLKGLSFRAFVYGIAAHKVTDAFRAIGRNRAEPVADLPDGPVTADGPEHRLLAAEMSARLGKLLAHLTPRQREVLVPAAGGRAVGGGDRAGGPVDSRRRSGHPAPGAGPARKILLGESGARGLAAAERLRVDHAAGTATPSTDPRTTWSTRPRTSPVPRAGHRPGRRGGGRLRDRRHGSALRRSGCGAGRRRPRPAQADAVQADLRRPRHPPTPLRTVPVRDRPGRHRHVGALPRRVGPRSGNGAEE